MFLDCCQYAKVYLKIWPLVYYIWSTVPSLVGSGCIISKCATQRTRARSLSCLSSLWGLPYSRVLYTLQIAWTLKQAVWFWGGHYSLNRGRYSLVNSVYFFFFLTGSNANLSIIFCAVVDPFPFCLFFQHITESFRCAHYDLDISMFARYD